MYPGFRLQERKSHEAIGGATSLKMQYIHYLYMGKLFVIFGRGSSKFIGV